MNTIIYKFSVNPVDGAQFKCRKHLAAVFKAARIAFVIGLGDYSSPFTVVFGVAFFVVFTLKPQAGFVGWQHVGGKILDALKPAVTHGDSSPSIPFPRFVAWVGASTDHALPHCVYRVSVTTSEPMGDISGPSALLKEATARLDASLGKIGLRNDLFGSARATTKPNLNGRFPDSPDPAEGGYRKATKHAARKILASHGRGRINLFSIHRNLLSLIVSAGRKLDLPASTPILSGAR